MTNTGHRTVGVRVGGVRIGGGAPVAVQSMTLTDTANAAATAAQCLELVDAGSELVRVTVNQREAAQAVPEIKRRLIDAGCTAPLIGDFHYNGHLLLTQYAECAAALDKYRINPGNVGTGRRRDEQFTAICKVAHDHDKPIRIGVNGGSLNQELVMAKMQENTDRQLGKTSDEIINDCMVLSALASTALALDAGLTKHQIIISCKVSRPRDLIAVYRALARQTDQPLHLGLTEAGMGTKGLVWSASAMGILLQEGIGDTIRVSLTPRPGGDRREEVYAACELLQALGLRSFAPSVTACPGCGRTTSTTFQELAERVQDYVRQQMPEWKIRYEGVEEMTVAVMGCVVNGPGESKAANIGISLPGTGEAPHCPVYIDGRHATSLRGSYDQLADGFRALIDQYVEAKYAKKVGAPAAAGHSAPLRRLRPQHSQRGTDQMAIRLIAIDIDGTLLDSRGQLPDTNRAAVRDALEAGVRVVLVTGRSFHHARPVGEALSDRVKLIVSNGALMKRTDGTTLHRRLLDRTVVREIIVKVREHRRGAALIFDREGPEQYVYEGIDWEHPNRRGYYAVNRQFMSELSPLEAALTEQPLQLAFTGSVDEMRCLADRVRRLGVAEQISITLTEYDARDFSLLDITVRGCSKGAMLSTWAKSLGVDTGEVMAVGDNLNDREMLALVGHPVVMENAVPELKRLGWPTTSSHDEGGLAEAIRKALADR